MLLFIIGELLKLQTRRPPRRRTLRAPARRFNIRSRGYTVAWRFHFFSHLITRFPPPLPPTTPPPVTRDRDRDQTTTTTTVVNYYTEQSRPERGPHANTHPLARRRASPHEPATSHHGRPFRNITHIHTRTCYIVGGALFFLFIFYFFPFLSPLSGTSLPPVAAFSLWTCVEPPPYSHCSVSGRLWSRTQINK